MSIKISKTNYGYEFLYDDTMYVKAVSHQEVLDFVKLCLKIMDRDNNDKKEEEEE